MTYKLFLAATAAVVLPASAMAEISGGTTVGFSRLTSPDGPGEVDVTTLDFALDYFDAGPIGFSIDAGRNSFDDEVLDDAVWNVDAQAFYRLNDISRIGGYVGRVSISDVDIDSYGLIWGYNLGTTSFEASLGQVDLDGETANEFTLWSQFDVAPNTRMSAEFGTAREDGDGINTYAVAAQHSLSNSIALFGHIRYTDVTEADVSLTEFGAGVSYDLASVTGFPTVLSLELGRTNLGEDDDDFEVDVVRFGVSLPLGGSGKGTVPLNSGASNVANGMRGVTAGLLSDGLLLQ